MKIKSLNSLLFAVFLLSTFNLAFAQSSVRTSAKLEYDNWMKESDKFSDLAKNHLLEAKKFIDEAYNYSSDSWNGKSDAKTLYYRGEIYAVFMYYMTDEKITAQFDLQEVLTTSLEMYKAHIDLPNKKSKEDFSETIINKMLLMRDQAAILATNSFNEGKYDIAFESYSLAIELLNVTSIVDTVSYFNGGLAAIRLEKFDTAALYFSKCVEVGFGEADSYTKWAEALFEQDKAEEAIKVLEKGREKYPKYSNLYISEGNYWWTRKDDKEKAKAAFEKAIASDPTNPTVYYAVGAIQLDIGDYENAEVNYNKAIEIKPDFLEALYGLGACYNNKAAELNKELNNLDDLSQLDAKNAELEGLLKKALGYFEKAHGVDSTDKPTIQSLYQLYVKLGDAENAKKMKDLLNN